LYTPDPMTASAAGDFLERTLQVWYGVWGHDPRGDGRAGNTDAYAFVTRGGMEAGDPATVTLLSSFFPTFHNYPAFLEEGFVGTFETAFESTLPYTHRSRYLLRVGQLGASSTRFNGNAQDGVYLGGDGDDSFEGRGGNDTISGGAAGFDRAYFSGARIEYVISASPLGQGATQIQDMIPNRDGVDQVQSIRELVFTDMTVQL